ncbi:MAG: ATP-dependent RecD-like DNA helicase [Lawsonibacter sp.]
MDFDGKVVEYTPDMLGELEPAFAVTVHKAQGSEYRAVILAALDGAPMLMTRGVLYTAITRAKELFIIVGTTRDGGPDGGQRPPDPASPWRRTTRP